MNYCVGVDLMNLQNCKFKGFKEIVFGGFADDDEMPQRSTSKLFFDIFDCERQIVLTNQQSKQLEKLLKSIGFEDVISIKNSDWEINKDIRGTWKISLRCY